MKIKPLLVVIFLVVLFARLLFSINNDFFSSDDSYFHLRQIDNISRTGMFLSYGTLSDKEFVFSPLFHYVFAVLYKFLPSIVFLKFINNLVLSLCVFLVFRICRLLTKNDVASLFGSFIFSFIPVFFIETFNDISPLSLLVPCLLYLFLNLLENNKNKVKMFLLVLVVSSFLSPLVVVFVASIIIFLVLLFIENIKLDVWSKEVLSFSIFFVLWSQIIIYKRAFFMHGSNIIWQNIPNDILNNFFSKISIIISIYDIGVVPLVLGTYAIFKYLFKDKSRENYLVISFCLAVSFMLWLKLIEVKLGLLFLGISLSLLSAQTVKKMILYLEKTKISAFFSKSCVFLVVVIALITSVIPTVMSAKAISGDVVRFEELEAMVWLRNNAYEGSRVLAHPNYGFMINTVAGKKSVVSNDFILLKNADELYDDVMRIFMSRSIVEIIELIDKYDVNYVFISSRFPLNNNELITKDGAKCFSVVFRSENVEVIEKIQNAECRVRVVR